MTNQVDPNCPVCGAWTERIRTRATNDTSLLLRTYDCGNLHRFTALVKTSEQILEMRLVDKGKQGRIVKPVIAPIEKPERKHCEK